MARGRGYGGGVVILTSTGADDGLLGSASTRAGRLASYTLSDHDDIRRQSRKQDKALLDDITSRLYKLEFDSVRPGQKVALKTGFRRVLYSNKRPPLEKETREELKKDRLRFPWDYTNDNLYRPKKDKSKKKSKKEQVRERAEKDHYPVYDPMGLYRPREKRNRAPYPDASLRTKQWETADVREMLTDLRVKAFSKRVARDPTDDTDTILRDLSRPLPKSEVASYVPYTGSLYDFKPSYQEDFEMDPRIHKKIADSKSDIDEFERMLNDRFVRKVVPGVSRADLVIASAREKTDDEIRRKERTVLLKRAADFEYTTYDDNLAEQVIDFLF